MIAAQKARNQTITQPRNWAETDTMQILELFGVLSMIALGIQKLLDSEIYKSRALRISPLVRYQCANIFPITLLV